MPAVLRLAAATLVASALVWGSSGGVGAHTYEVPNDITARWSQEKETFRGRVTSGRASCFRERLVKVYSEGGHSVGNDYTDRRGRWRVHVEDPPSQTYNATLFPTPVRDNEQHHHECAGDHASVRV